MTLQAVLDGSVEHDIDEASSYFQCVWKHCHNANLFSLLITVMFSICYSRIQIKLTQNKEKYICKERDIRSLWWSIWTKHLNKAVCVVCLIVFFLGDFLSWVCMTLTHRGCRLDLLLGRMHVGHGMVILCSFLDILICRKSEFVDYVACFYEASLEIGFIHF